MSIRPMDEQKCPLDIQVSVRPLDEQKCPVDIQMSIGHLAEVLDMYVDFFARSDYFLLPSSFRLKPSGINSVEKKEKVASHGKFASGKPTAAFCNTFKAFWKNLRNFKDRTKGISKFGCASTAFVCKGLTHENCLLLKSSYKAVGSKWILGGGRGAGNSGNIGGSGNMHPR